MRINKILAVSVALIFFVLGIFTLKDYGINWDSVNHLLRGQAYLWYMLTGEKKYDSLPGTFYTSGAAFIDKKYWQDPDSLLVKVTPNEKWAKTRSLYQNDDFNFDYVVSTDGYGHPAASDIISSFFNYVLFQKLHLINDIDSYRVYGIFLASILIGLISYWVSEKYSRLSGLITAIAIGTYPLFWAESHFNTEKDIPETAFWGIFMYLFYQGATKKKPLMILLSALVFGLTMGTKFNALFIIPIVSVWFLTYAIRNKWFLRPVKFIQKNKLFILSLILVPVISFIVYVFFWPYLWENTMVRIVSTVKFYRDIGRVGEFYPRYLGPFGINTYPLQWIFYTTYPFIFLLAALGIYKLVIDIKKDLSSFGVLILLWFWTPIVRVVWPGTNIYGGVRQIMEFIPALAILAGIGAHVLVNFLKNKKTRLIGSSLVILCFTPLLVYLFKIHPYENAYFNVLAGGLSGAKQKDILYWGNTFGGAYRKAVVWLNQNAEKKSKVVFAYELMPNIPGIFFRDDLEVSNVLRSGYLAQGEYAITLTFQGTDKRSYYDMYLERMLEPVFVGEVDGVSVVKVWKNDKKHLKKEYINEKQSKPFSVTQTQTGVLLDLGKQVSLSRVEGSIPKYGCEKIQSAVVKISSDKTNWITLPNVLPDDWMVAVLGEQPKDGRFIHPFAGDLARYIEIYINPQNACLKKIYNIKIFHFS